MMAVSSSLGSRTSRKGAVLDFRPLAEADVAAVMALEASLQSHPWRRASYDDCLEGRHLCWLAECEGELVGFVVASCAAGEAELLNLAVAANWQRQGVGECLLDALDEALGAAASMLFLEVRVSNHSAIAFYQQQDFFEVGHRPNYYPSGRGREDALIMARQR